MKRRQLNMPAGMVWPPAISVGLYRMQQERLAQRKSAVVVQFRRRPKGDPITPHPPAAA